jgi:hypothetical protein
MATLNIEGKRVTVDDSFLSLSPEEQGATVDQIAATLRSKAPPAEQAKMAEEAKPSAVAEVAGDVAKSAGAGLAKGGIGLLGLPGDVAEYGARGMDRLTGLIGRLIGESDTARRPDRPPTYGSADIQSAVEQHTGEFYKPKTRVGRVAETLGEFAPGAAIPGGWARRLIGGVTAPALAAEGASEITPKQYEPYGRVAAALAAGIGATSLMKAGIPKMPQQATERLTMNVGPDAESKLTQLGPGAMLMDATPSSTTLAADVANQLGAPRDRIVKALGERTDRVATEPLRNVETSLGAWESPTRIEGGLQKVRDATGPGYRVGTKNAAPADASALIDDIEHEIQVAAGADKRMLEAIKRDFHGTQKVETPTGKIKDEARLKDSAEELLNIRHSIDNYISKAEKLGQGNSVRLAMEIREKLNALLPESIRKTDAVYASAAQRSEALKGKYLDMPVQDLRALRSEMTPGQWEMVRVRMRDEIEQQLRNSANDVTALKKMFGGPGDNTRAVLNEVFSKGQADQLFADLQRNLAFAETHANVLGNSKTAERTAVAQQRKAFEPTPLSWTDFASFGLGRAVSGANALRARNAARETARADDALSTALTSTGDERDKLLAAIRSAQADTPESRVAQLLARSPLWIRDGTADRRPAAKPSRVAEELARTR